MLARPAAHAAGSILLCVFCAVISADERGTIFRDEHVVAFLDHAPVFPGHTLVVPARHYDTLEDVPESDVAPLFLLACRLSIAFRPPKAPTARSSR